MKPVCRLVERPTRHLVAIVVERERQVCRTRSAATAGNIVAGSAGLCCTAEDAAGPDAAGVVRDVAVVVAACVIAIVARCGILDTAPEVVINSIVCTVGVA